MVIGIIHSGSGLGDSLFTYITTRTIALDKGYDFGFVGTENFKGKDFMQLDWGKPVDLKYHTAMPSGKLIVDDEHRLFEFDKTSFDPESQFIEDGTVIDATCAQDERYWGHRLNEIREWLKVEPLYMPDEVCVINFRGGEYATVLELFLPKEYWQEAIAMKKAQGVFSFEVHTDDVELAEGFFPHFPLIKNIQLNWRSVRYTKHLILANSAFGILPALLNENVKEVIAPRYWARRNIKQWSMSSNYYKKFTYI